MAKHEELLSEGPRTAPEPETAEERSHGHRRGILGGLLGGGAVALKLGAFTKLLIWLAVWNGATSLLRYAGWPGLVIGAVAIVAVTVFVGLSRRRTKRAAARLADGLGG